MLSEKIENSGLYKRDSNAYNRGKAVQIRGRDFPSWLATLQLCDGPNRDYVIVKIDIEGIEYLVLSRILELGLACVADKWLVVFHHAKRSKHPSTTGVIHQFVAAIQSCPKHVVLDQNW